MIRVLLAEDHHLVRKGIITLLAHADDINIVGEVETGLAAVEYVKNDSPDVVVMDVNMPGLNGIQAAEQIQSAKFPTQIVMLSLHFDEAILRQALRAGVKGFFTQEFIGWGIDLGDSGCF